MHSNNNVKSAMIIKMILCVLFVFHSATSAKLAEALISDNVSSSNETVDSEFKLGGKITVDIENSTERYVHQMSRSLQFETSTVNTTSLNEPKNITLISDFKPSRQLDTFFEHNKFTVPPALPEAKIANQGVGYGIPERTTTVPSWIEKQSLPKPWQRTSWNEVPGNNVPRNSGSWVEKSSEVGNVKFPPANDYDRPYKYVTGPENLPSISYPGTTEGFAFNQPVEVQTTPKPTQSIWTRFMSTIGLDPRGSEPAEKTFSGYNLLERPVYYNQQVLPYAVSGHGGYGVGGHDGGYGVGVNQGGYGVGVNQGGYGVGTHQTGYGYGGHSGFSGYGGFGGFGEYGGYSAYKSGVSPWKKVIKFLAAVIPIGLFLSALAPTVIQVQSVNDTESKYRNDDTKDDLAKRFASSLSYFSKLNDEGCEDKVLCELLVSASFSKNAEENIKHLLDNFVRSEDLQNKKGDLLKIFEAVKNQDCKPIPCGSIST